MPGFFRKIEGVPPYPGKCGLCSLTHHDEIHYFIDTSYFAEVEGQLYICNRCFSSLVLVTQDYMPVDRYEAEKAFTLESLENDLVDLQNYRRAGVILKEQFNLDLEDLFKYQDILPELESTQRDFEEAESKLLETKNTLALNKSILESQIGSIEAVEARLREKNAEIDELIESSLTQILDRRGRADLVAILLNNELPKRAESAPDGSEQQAFSFSGEDDSEPLFAS